MTRREHVIGVGLAIFVAVFVGVTVVALARPREADEALDMPIYAGVAAISAATAMGAYLLFAHAVASSREEQARRDELEARAREEGQRRREALARAQAEAAKRGAAPKAAPPEPPPPNDDAAPER